MASPNQLLVDRKDQRKNFPGRGKKESGAQIVDFATENAELVYESSAAGFSNAQKFTGSMALQITGAATAVSVQLHTSTVDPFDENVTPNWAPVLEAEELITGNPATGITVRGFVEPSEAWWTVEVISVTGAVVVSLRGKEPITDALVGD